MMNKYVLTIIMATVAIGQPVVSQVDTAPNHGEIPIHDADRDGLPDNRDPDPIIANYTALKWEVTSISLAYDVKQQTHTQRDEIKENTDYKSTIHQHDWLVGADGRLEGRAQIYGRISSNPLELFGLHDLEAQISGGLAASASARGQMSVANEGKAISSRKEIVATSETDTISNCHFSFSVNIRNFSSFPLSMLSKPIPILIAERDVASAYPIDIGSKNDTIEIPADRPEGVLVQYRADIKDTKAVELKHCLQRGDSPTIDLKRSLITIKAKRGSDEVDLLSKIRRMEAENCLLTVRTGGGSVAWYIAREFDGKPVTLRHAMESINKMLRRESSINRDFFEIADAGIKNIANYGRDGVWLRRDGHNSSKIDVKLLDTQIPKYIEIALLEKDTIKTIAREVMNAPGREAERRVLLAMQDEYPLWKTTAEEFGWPEAIYLMGKSYQYGVAVNAEQSKACDLFRKVGDAGWSYGYTQLGHCYRTGTGVSKDEHEAVKWYRKAVDNGDVVGKYFLGYCYQTGTGVSRDEAEAIKLFRAAAEQGNQDAIQALKVEFRPAPAPEAKAADSPAAKPAEPLAVRASYLFGLQTGMQLRGAGLDADDLDSAAFVKGVKEGLGGGKPKLNNEEVQATFAEFQTALAAKAAKSGEKNRADGVVFLAKNKFSEGVKSTASGLQYKVLKEGAGNSPAATDNVTVHYKGTLLDGKTFDSSYDRGQPATFAVKSVIKGWTEALQLMKPGGKYQLWIPADLAYGDDSPPGIPPGSTLIFEVELLKIERAR